MTKTEKRKIQFRSYCAIIVTLIVVSVLFSIFRFRAQALRVFQSGKDLVTSIGYYFSELFEIGSVKATITEIPEGLTSYLPIEWADFKLKCKTFRELLFEEQNLKLYFAKVGNIFGRIAEILLMLMIPVILGGIVVSSVYETPNNDYNEDTKALQRYKKIEEKIFAPIKNYIKGLFSFVKESVYGKILFGIWCYNFSVFTILIEAVAFVFYFSMSIDFVSFYTLFVKVGIDLTAPISFLPRWVWAIIGWIVFDWARRKIGLKRLRSYEEKNRTFLETYLGALFLVGKQRAKKTTIITDMALTQEMIYRDKAKEKLAECDKQFPYFPWINVELFYREGQARHTLPTLAMHRQFLKTLRYHFERDIRGRYKDPAVRKSILRHLKKRYGYAYKDFIFEYDHARYGTTYNNALGLIHVFEAIENYVQLFYIYAAPTSLIFGNYAIRTDVTYETYGNFPDITCDFFDSDAEEVVESSQYSHPINFNFARLGKVTDEEDPYKDGFEVGIWTIMEFAKERGNQNTNVGIKADSHECNQRNDGFELNTKMEGHSATIMYYTFFRPFYDDQRPDSLSADNKDLCDVIMIKGVSDAKIVVPFFAWGELIHMIATSIYDGIYYKIRKFRGDNTLLVYLLKKVYSPLHKRYDRIFNQFSVYTAQLKIWDAMGDEVLTDKGRYYISTKKTYSTRFATDGIKDFYHQKALMSKYGLNDYPTFGDVKMTVEEMESMRSHFYTKINKIFRKEEKTQKKAG